jgi:GT2 family glycosyltransferase
VIAPVPKVSVVVPTHQRCESLRRLLNALRAQTYPAERMELVVVADGCTDGTADLLRSERPPFGFRFLEQPGLGATMARSHGAAWTTGDLILFLDDDTEPAPGLVEAHVRAHAETPGGAVVGALPPVMTGALDLARMGIRSWWDDEVLRLARRGHRFGYGDLLTGNVSVAAATFAAVGGFDTTFRCREDYELGLRLIRAGAPLRFAPDAVARHHESSGLDRSLRRVQAEGAAEVKMGLRHPELRLSLPLAEVHALGGTLPWLQRMALARSRRGVVVARILRLALPALERLRLRGSWRRVYNRLRGYHYWRGVGDEVGGPRGLAAYLHAGLDPAVEPEAELEVDLAEGLERIEVILDRERPSGLRIRYGDRFVGRLPPKVGAEPLRGEHLRAALLDHLAVPLITALAIAGVEMPGIRRRRAARQIRT